MAGFPCTGIEMAAEIVRLSQDMFDIDVRKGPLEELSIHLGAQPLAICMFDVLEHLPDPSSLLRDLLQRSTGSITLIVQTPEFTDSMSDTMFVVPEHINLFTRGALCDMLRQAGFLHMEFAESLFPSDMTVVASNAPISENTEAAIVEALLHTSDGRVLNAMRGLAERLGEARAKNRLLEGDGMGIRWTSRQLVRSLLRRLGLRRET